MTPAAQLQYEIGRAGNTLRLRQASSADAGEKKTLRTLVRRLAKMQDTLEDADALVTANTLADAIAALEAAVGAIRHGPFDGYLATLEAHFETLSMLSAGLHREDALPPAPEEEDAADRPPADRPRSRGTRAKGSTSLPAGLAPPSTQTDFATLEGEYNTWFSACTLRPGREGEVAYYRKRLDAGRAVYAQVGDELGIPWTFIGITHGMECGFNFNCHLHNGDPLKACTVQVPKGRPTTGKPPFTWSQSARDALVYKGYHEVADWRPAHMLYLFERYNGMGYRRRGLASPYLWSYSNLYEKGKFVADGRFDPEAVSKQCGAALLLKTLLAG